MENSRLELEKPEEGEVVNFQRWLSKRIGGNDRWINSDALGMKKRELNVKVVVWIIYKMLERVEKRKGGSL